MKIEFKKVQTVEKEFDLKLDSVKFSGTFCKISHSLIKVNSTIYGKVIVECCKCGIEHYVDINENQCFILSDGEFSSGNERENETIIEIENHVVDFSELLLSEIESTKLDYHTCDSCQINDKFIDIEY